MKSVTIAAALGALLVSSSASAWDNPQSNTVAAKPSQDRTYCLQVPDDTGSHVNRVECRTKREWAQRGVDVDTLIDKEPPRPERAAAVRPQADAALSKPPRLPSQQGVR